MKTLHSQRTACGAFSLLEMLMTVAVISMMIAVAMFAISGLRRAAEETKLHRDVASINNAIRTYMVNGGSFSKSELDNPGTVLAKLKKRASPNSAREIAGLRESMIDSRLTFVLQSRADAVDGAERA